MDIAVVLLRQNVIMAVYMMIGYLLYQKKLVTTTGSGEMGKLLVYVVMPVTIVKAYMVEFSAKMLLGLGISLGAAAACLLLSVLISRLLFKRYPMEHFGAAFSNAGFIGIPLAQAALGEQAVFYISSYVAFLNILQWTYGVYVMTENKESIAVRKIVTNPVVLGFAAGILLFFLPVKLPGVLTGVVHAIAGMNAPVAMIILGTYLAQLPFSQLLKGRLCYACTAVRLLLIPLASMALLCAIPNQYRIIKLTVLIAAAAPVGSNVAIFAQINGKDYTMAVKEVCISTVLCIISLPAIVGLASWIWQ